ncbi:MAG: diacylglycerol kinase family protein [Polyangiaceae bacterium]
MQSSSSICEVGSAVLLFPRAGGFLRHPKRLDRYRSIGKSRAIVYDPVTSTELDQACAEICRCRPERVLLVGGDGSLMRGISALTCAYRGAPLPHLVPVPAGTVNLCASRWGCSGSVDSWYSAALEGKASRLLRAPTLRVCLEETPFVAFTLGAGLVSHFFEAYDQSVSPGKGTAFRIFARTFLGSLFGSTYATRLLAPVSCRVEIDGDDVGPLALSLLVTSVFANVGLGLKPTYRAGSMPGRIHLVASTLPAKTLGPLAWRVLRGLPLRPAAVEPEVIDRMVTSFSVRFDRARRVVLDGDALATESVRVAVGPELNLVLPT